MDRATNTIITPVPDILDFLFSIYGVVEDEDHIAREEEVQNMNYNSIDLIVTVFNEIDDLAE